MKNNIRSIGIFALVFLIFSCSRGDKSATTISILEEAISVHSLVNPRSFVESNQELDVQGNLANPEFVKELSDTDIAKLKAAVYRFYSTVDVKEDLYITSLEKAEEINISKNLFKVFKDNLEEMNRDIKRAKAKGNEVTVQEVNSEYLESLLR